MAKPPIPRRVIKSRQTIPQSKIKPILKSNTEKKYENRVSIAHENILEVFEKMDFLKDLIDSDPEFVRQFHDARKNLKSLGFSGSIDNAIYQQLLYAKVARIIKKDPYSTRERIQKINKKMNEIYNNITTIESLHEKRKPHLSKEQLTKLEFEKNAKILELKKQYSELLEEKQHIKKLLKLTIKQIEELENIR
ncbi:MAG TPA: hypothetical protein PLK55_03590 [archaeon]|jgi:hypothetical protein|nr:hypothetical protein [archaeon]